MDRKEFIKVVGLGAASFSLIAFLEHCSKSNNTKVDFTIDLTNSQYSSLTTKGNFVITNNVIVAHASSGYIAVSAICTHAGCTVQYTLPQNEFYCPCHGSLFSSGGGVIQGPAVTALASYNVSQSGNSLHIYS